MAREDVMEDQFEDQFDRIAQKAIVDAGAVRCSIEDYISGLRQIGEEIDAAIDAAKPDLFECPESRQQQKESE